MIRVDMKNKNNQRIRRATKTRAKIAESGNHRISIHRSIQHMYLQLISPRGDKVITTVSTNQKDNKAKSNNIESAKDVGAKMATYIKKLKLRMLHLIDQDIDITAELKLLQKRLEKME